MSPFIAPPVFDDAEETRRAGVLHIILFVLAGAVAVLMVIAALTSPAPLPAFSIGVVTEVLTAGLLWLNRRGQVQRASFLLALALWAIVTLSVWFLGGPYASPRTVRSRAPRSKWQSSIRCAAPAPLG